MKSIRLLREDLDTVDEHIRKRGWNEVDPIVRSYRHWLISALQFIQLKNIDKS